jgi:hypothetical protein
MMTDFGMMLREHGFHAPHVTPAGLEDALEKHGVKQKKMMEDMFEKYAQMSSSKVAGGAAAVGCDGWRTYWWPKGAETQAHPRIVPHDFSLPTEVTTQTAWNWWWSAHLSDRDRNVTLPPVRACNHYHLPRAQQPRWSEWKGFFEECVDELPEDVRKDLEDAYKKKDVTLEMLNRAYACAVPVVQKYRATSKRQTQLMFGTILRNRSRLRARNAPAEQQQ